MILFPFSSAPFQCWQLLNPWLWVLVFTFYFEWQPKYLILVLNSRSSTERRWTSGLLAFTFWTACIKGHTTKSGLYWVFLFLIIQKLSLYTVWDEVTIYFSTLNVLDFINSIYRTIFFPYHHIPNLHRSGCLLVIYFLLQWSIYLLLWSPNPVLLKLHSALTDYRQMNPWMDSSECSFWRSAKCNLKPWTVIISCPAWSLW